MQENIKKHERALFGKIITVISLPLLTFTWMIGWTLILIGERQESRESVQKTMRIHPRFESHIKNFEPMDEDTKVEYEQPITA